MKELLEDLKKLNEKESLSVDDIINIRNNSIGFKIEDELLDEERQIKTDFFGLEPLPRLAYDEYYDTYVATEDEFESIINSAVNKFISELPDGFDAYIDIQALKDDAKKDNIILSQLSPLDPEIKKMEEVEYNGDKYYLLGV